MIREPISGHPGITLRTWNDSGGKLQKRYDATYRGPDLKKHSQTFERLGDADRWLRDHRSRVDQGVWTDPSAGKIRLRAFVEKWQGGTAHLSAHTRRRYRSLLRTHILPALGDLPINRISRADVQGLMSKMQAAGLSPKTVRHAHALLSGILRAALEDGLIARLPTEKIGLPRLTHAEQRYLSHEEVARLAATEPLSPRYGVLVLLSAYGALRWGELAGLKVQRLRLLERKIDVVETDQGTAPKWGSSRTVTIPAEVAEELARHLAAYPPGPAGLVFTAPEGGALRYTNFYRRHWRKAVESAGLAPLRAHDLRHTAVALSIEAGAHPKEIQELCGHRSITTTLNEYGHLFPQLHERLAERLGEGIRAARARSRPDHGPIGVVASLDRAAESRR